MPLLFVDTDAPPITSSQTTAYLGAEERRALGAQTAQEQAVVAATESSLRAIAETWRDETKQTTTYQRDLAPEILERAAALQGELARVVRQWARPGREQALMEMFGVLTRAIVERDRLLLELRERVKAGLP